MLRLITVLSLVLFCAASQSQESRYEGRWHGALATPDGNQLDVDLAIKGSTGTWRMRLHSLAAGRLSPCLDRDLPVVVLSESDTELVIHIQGAKVMQGCLNQRARFQPVDGKTLEGRLGDGRTMKLSR